VLVAAMQAVLVLWQVVDWPITASFFFLGIVVAMTYQMTSDVVRAAEMSDDLRRKDQWLDLAADSAGVGLWLWDLKCKYQELVGPRYSALFPVIH
jgi:two-component system, LuxR family, sensor kinase FixL